MVFSTAENTSQSQGCATNKATMCCLRGPRRKAFGKDQQHIYPCLLLLLALILLHKPDKPVELLDSCSKDYCLWFFTRISRKNFLEGHTTTHAYTKNQLTVQEIMGECMGIWKNNGDVHEDMLRTANIKSQQNSRF